MGILLGGMLSVVFVAVKFLLNDTGKEMIQTVDDLREMYPDIMVLATIPDMRLNEKKNGYYSAYYVREESPGKEGKRSGKHQRA